MNSFLVNLPLVVIGVFIVIAAIIIIDSEKRPVKKTKTVKSSRKNVVK